MIKHMRRGCLLLMAACVLSAGACCHQVYAGENIQFGLTEDAESLPGEGTPDVPAETGILLVENPCGEGSLEITGSMGTFTAECDCSDWEGFLGEVCTVRVTPCTGYVVDTVLFDGEPLVPGEDGTYSLVLEKEMSELVVTYAVSDLETEPDGEMPGDKLREYSAGGDDAAVPADSFDRAVSGDISYDIIVTYEDEAPKTGVASTGARGPVGAAGSRSFESTAVINGMGTAPAEAVLVSADDSAMDVAAVPAAEEQIAEHVEPPVLEEPAADEPETPEAEPTEEPAVDMAMNFEEESEEKPLEDPARPAYTSMAVMPELREPADVVWDRKLIYVLAAGGVLSVLSACAVRRR